MKFNLSSRKDKKPDSQSTWINLNTIDQINEIKEQSTDHTVVIFKHSTRCSISSMAKQRLLKGLEIDSTKVPFYYLDLIAHREISNTLADEFGIQHESPQLLVVKNGEVVFHTSHNGVTPQAVHDHI